MASRALLLTLFCGLCVARSIPEDPTFIEGFKPVQGARGPPSSSPSFNFDTRRLATRSAAQYNHGFGSGILESGSQNFGGSGILESGSQNFGGQAIHPSPLSSGGHQSLGEPDKTIYVRLPHDNSANQFQQPKSAAPPQKHYRIVIIKSPTPAPVQPVLPPRTEQKTIIYVLHQKPKVVAPQILEAPTKKHPPQVLFVGYDDELTANDLKQLAEGNHDGFSVTSQQNPLLESTHGATNFGSADLSNFGSSDFSNFDSNSFGSGSSFNSGGGGFSYGGSQFKRSANSEKS